MSYDYDTEKPKLFTGDGVAKVLEVRDKAFRLIEEAGAVRADKLIGTGDSWLYLAVFDYLCERGDLVYVSEGGHGAQHRIFTRFDY